MSDGSSTTGQAIGSVNTARLGIAGLLLQMGSAFSKFAARHGIPVLVVFPVVAMLAGSEGVGGTPFEANPLANNLGGVALALILVACGLPTSLGSLRRGATSTHPLYGQGAGHFITVWPGSSLAAQDPSAARTVAGQNRWLHRCS